MHINLKTIILVHVCYRSVFNAPVSIEDLKVWLGISSTNDLSFNEAISHLKSENLIQKKEGYLSAYGSIHLIDEQEEKNRHTEVLINKGSNFLALFSKLPFVKYIGISGSLAANNPTLDKNGTNKGKVDMDLFVISTANTLWILFLFERIITNIHKLIFRHHFYCFNYVTDETFLEIHNKNFYTATELNNLKAVYDDGVYNVFMKENLWCKRYYSNIILKTATVSNKKTSVLMNVFMPFNYLCFALFCIGRAIKRLEIQPLLEIRATFNPKHKTNFKRIANSNGGYQEAIRNRFETIFKQKFSDYYSKALMLDLFPTSDSFHFTTENKYDAEINELFKKYA